MIDNDNTLIRLRKIEGQIKGIQRMVEEKKYCGDILIQISAARSALNSVGGIVLENYMKNCIQDSPNSTEEDLEKLIQVMLKYTK